MSARSNDPQRGGIEIPATPAKGRWVTLVAFAIGLIVIVALFVLLFIQFTASWRLALILVLFLVGYMLLMGYWASRNVEGRDER